MSNILSIVAPSAYLPNGQPKPWNKLFQEEYNLRKNIPNEDRRLVQKLINDFLARHKIYRNKHFFFAINEEPEFRKDLKQTFGIKTARVSNKIAKKMHLLGNYHTQPPGQWDFLCRLTMSDRDFQSLVKSYGPK